MVLYGGVWERMRSFLEPAYIRDDQQPSQELFENILLRGERLMLGTRLLITKYRKTNDFNNLLLLGPKCHRR